MNIVRHWRKVLAVGCSHGQMLDPAARDAVMKFKERWRPHDIMHLGDACDTTAFMGGAAGKAQESEPVRPDIDAGLEFIVDLGVTIWTLGNHEDRIWRALKDQRGIVRACAENTVATIEDLCEKSNTMVLRKRNSHATSKRPDPQAPVTRGARKDARS